MKSYRWLAGFSLAFILILFCACSGSGDSDPATVETLPVSDIGSLELGLMDATSDHYSAVYITIDEVQVHLGDGDGNWISILNPEGT